LAARRLAAVVAELDRTDPGWRLDDLLAVPHAMPLPDADNLATPLAEFATTDLRRDNDAGNRRAELLAGLAPNVRLTRGQWRAVVDSLEATEEGIPLVLGLDRYPRGRHAITYTADGLSTELPHMNLLRLAAALLDDLHLSAVQRGDAATALRAFHATLNLGRSVREEPILATQLLRARLRGAAVHGLERLLGHVELADSRLADIERELRAELADDLGLLAARGELALMDRVAAAICSGAIKSATLRQRVPVTPPPPTPVERVADWFHDHVGADASGDHADLLEVAARTVTAARLPWPGRWAAVQALPGDGPSQSALVGRPMPDLARWFGQLAVDEARVRCALAAVVVERHRLARGDWPASLAELGPLPDDPFTGKPLRYKRLADGVVVYSVGSEGTDDGGALTETSRQQTRPGSDLGFRLWDVPRRNRPAGEGQP
jgi:hypothetical protein